MMNIKRNIFAVLAAAVLLASCSQDEVMTDTGPDGLVPVTLSAAVGDGVQTRAVDTDDDEDATYCYVQVCDEQGNAYTDNDYATPTRLTDEDKDGTFTGNIYLRPNVTYVFLFWADNVTSTVPTDLHYVTYQKESIAFADRVEQTIGSVAPTVNATLQHVVAKVTLKTTTNVEAGSRITVTAPTTYMAYNVAVGDVIQERKANNTSFEHTVTNAITGTKDGAEVFSFYALVKDETQNITLANGTNSQRVSNVPLGPNMHTTLVGDVRNLGLTDVTFTASIDKKWDDTETEIIGLEIANGGTTYIVSSPAALQAWAAEVQNDASLNCTLADNITLPEVEEGESNWTTVGTYTGTFDGAGHTITGLTGKAGLFDKIDTDGEVKNLKLEGVEITESGCGAIARESSGTITACSVSGSVEGSSNSTTQGVGGIVGMNSAGTVSGCSMKGTVTNSGIYVGGIVGYCYGGNVIDCHSSATVTGTANVGGVVGKQYGIAKVIASSSTGDVTATRANDYVYAGGVVGHANGGFIICCYATGDISGQHQQVGGVVGYNASTIIACYHAEGNVSGTDHVGGVVGYNGRSTITACYWSNDVDNGFGTDETNVGEATKVDGNWTDAVTAMNAALEDYDWEWTIEAPNALPTPVKKETN